MEIRFYTSDMDFVGIMENQKYVNWSRRYFEPGSFEIIAPITDDNIALTARSNLVWIRGAAEAGVIEDRLIEEGATNNQITARGRFLSSYMDRRLIRPKVNFSGRIEVAMRQLLSGAEPLPLVELGTLMGFTDTITFQASYKNLLSYEEKLAQSGNYGFRFRPNFSDKKIVFEIYKGVDRTLSQSDNSRVVFSEQYNNLTDIQMRETDQLLKNCIYIGGQVDEDTGARTIVSFGTENTGLERRELFVDARDMSPDDLTEAEYAEKLLQRGHEKQLEYAESASIECTTNMDSNFVYKKDYDLGDMVSVRKKRWNITIDLRITGIDEVYEPGNTRIIPTFGTPLAAAIDWSDN